ncbi:B9 domain-containing protein 2 [Tetrabaena socialis]|uniref:B9 domain-containing protein 2 n=1 Tax=Tetrabaena socialis TaxID=47790 RepID=A0A2J8A0M8_9CHLO|nr:B9 domain-containing protein 2 [Tetrabaena socialis]|eukprot:PNH06038.1 B9 domain-containing protein 2 [Tetrabaena socialis]
MKPSTPQSPSSLQEMPSLAPAGLAPPAGRSGSATEQSIVEGRNERRARRRLAQDSPGEGRNSRPSGNGEAERGMVSPTRQQQTPPRGSSAGGEADADMSRYGLVGDPFEAASPITRPPRRRMSSAGGGVTPSEHGSELDSPLRRHGSRTDLHSSYDSLDSLAAASRATRRGSGFKKRGSPVKGAKAAAIKNSFADLHILGEIVGASGFQFPMLFCRWQLLYEPSKSWQVLRGQQQGTTHACCSAVGEVDLVVWEHPLDIHVKTQSLQGWPALLLMVYARNESSGCDSFVSYALVPLPSTPGMHRISSHTWFAVESNRALGRSFFAWHTGLIPRLEDETFIIDQRKREDAGPFISTVGAGEVHLRLNILTKNLDQVTHQGGESLAAALERLTTNILRQSTTLANKSMAREEHRHEALTEGQKLVKAGREERMASARAALDSRRRSAADGASPAPSESSR